MKKNATALILFSAVTTSSFSSFAVPCPSLRVHDIKWAEITPFADVGMVEKIGPYVYTWISNLFPVGEATAITAARRLTADTDDVLSCKYEIVLYDGSHKEEVEVDVFLDKIANFYPRTLDDIKAQELIEEYHLKGTATISEDGYTWTLNNLSEAGGTKTSSYKINKVEFVKNSTLTRKGGGIATVVTTMKFIRTIQPTYEIEATLKSNFVPHE
jgi:hypothetical protein